MARRRDLDKFIDETRASQRNIVFPDTVRNGRAVDAFLLRGSPNPPLVQRIVAWMLGIVFMGCGIAVLNTAIEDRHEDGLTLSLVGGIIALAWFLLGVKVFRNGFPRRTKPAQD